jgi:hypothetical protein
VSVLPLFHGGILLAGAIGVSVFARSSERRRDARETLKILLRRRASR